MEKVLLDYYAGDEFPADVWKGKYAIKNASVQELAPPAMHIRMGLELSRIEMDYKHTYHGDTSEMYKKLMDRASLDPMEYLDRYKYIIPQGSIMTMLGNHYTIGSLSNCFVIPSPLDSYGGIFKTDQQIAQLEKRRGGVGTNLNSLRPENTGVMNAAGTSTGAHSFMDRYSNTTREVAQNGRRGALMLLMSCEHPDIFKFVTKKSDLTRVTGANISVQLTDKFMEAALKDKDFYCVFPVGFGPLFVDKSTLPYNELVRMGKSMIMRIKAKELLDLIVEMAWSNGEPGVAFMDTVVGYSPEGVYDQFRPVASNPCGEQWMQAYDACRLLALNYYNIVNQPFTKKAKIDYEKLYEIAYVQQRYADDVVDLEIEHVEKILRKIAQDPEPQDVKATEHDLWVNIKNVAEASRRTGCGFTALADMIAALGLKYDSPEAISIIKEVSKTKMRAELDSTIDMAIERGPFKGWDKNLEFFINGQGLLEGKNDFYQMLIEEFPEQADRMYKHGRRNVSWSTVAPTGTVSIVALLDKYANTSAGIEPQFATHYFRNKKVNPSDNNVRVDFTDQNGDAWMTYPVIMGGLKEWIRVNYPKMDYIGLENLSKDTVEKMYKESPYFESCANDISWEKRIEIQGIVQKYTTNAISSTLNLPKDVSKEVVANIYERAWQSGLKGVTVYRDGCRTGVLNLEKKTEGFSYANSAKRPKELPAELSIVTVKSVKYAVVVGLFDGKPYELFAFNLPEEIKESCNGYLIKAKKGHYNFRCENVEIKDIQNLTIHTDEAVLTRLISGMLRHGAKPQFVMEQIDKCNLSIVSFGKAVSRVLKRYVSEEDMVSRNTCSNCKSTNLQMREGCLVCLDCSNSKCG